MSADYPNREVWLAKRATPVKLERDTYLFISKRVMWNPATKSTQVQAKGDTANAGITKLKRARYAAKLALRKQRHALKKSLKSVCIPTPSVA